MQSRQILSLYHALLANANKFHNYNFREFAKRRITREFRKNKVISDANLIEQKFLYGKEQLELVKRQVIISSLYPEAPSVIEKFAKKSL